MTGAVSVLVIAFFVTTYAYNLIAFSRDSLRGDQWEWVEFVLIPFERGDIGLFDALTYEYAVLGHSHIPTLAVFLFSFEFLDLDLSADRVIGLLSLATILVIVFRHCRESLRPDAALAVTALASTILFRSSSASDFAWSLLQFQMLYICVAVVYLRSFVARARAQPLLHASVVVPAVLLLGDAIGVAAVLAGLVYLPVLWLRGRVPFRTLVTYYLLFPVQLLLLHAIFRGERPHTGASWPEFLRHVVAEPIELLGTSARAVASVFVALRPGDDTLKGPAAGPLLEWGHAPVWFVFTIAVVVLAAVVITRTGPRAHDHFPLLLILAGSIWVLGVMKARLIDLGPDAIEAPRYSVYIGLVGIGVIMLVGSRLRSPELPARWLVAPALVLVVANGLTTFQLIPNDIWVDRQKQELTELRAYALDEVQEYDVVGDRCSRRSCLRAAWFLSDMRLGAFDGDDSAQFSWAADFTNVLYDGWDSLPRNEQLGGCFVAALDDQRVVEWVYGDAGLAVEAAIRREGIRIPDEERAQADRIAVRMLRDRCADLELGPFDGDDRAQFSWAAELRVVVYDGWDSLRGNEKLGACLVAALDDQGVVEWVYGDVGLGVEAAIRREGILIPDEERADAERVAVAMLRGWCG